MAVKTLRLFGIGQQSKSPNLTAQKRINIYYDVQADDDRVKISAFGTPGTTFAAVVSGSVTRGIHWFETANTLYVVQRGDLYAVANNYVATLKRSLTTTNPTDIAGFCSMANNGFQLCIVTGAFGYIYNYLTNTLTNITASLPAGGADTVTFLDGFFIVNRSGTSEFYKSALYDGLTWNGLDFDNASTSPDNVVAVMASEGFLSVWGTSSRETWANAGTAGFPFSYVQGSGGQTGLQARWSLAIANGLQTGLVRNKQGALAIGQLDGYSLQPISTSDIDYLINNYAVTEDAVAFGYSLNGRAFYQITFPTESKSWLYDFISGAWSQLITTGLTKHFALLGAAFNTDFVIAGFENGNLYKLDADAITDNGIPIEREIQMNHVFNNDMKNVIINRIRIGLENGTGTAQLGLFISRDYGHTFGMPLYKDLGNIGQYKRYAEWRALGQGRDWVMKLRTVDPIKFILTDAIMTYKVADR